MALDMALRAWLRGLVIVSSSLAGACGSAGEATPSSTSSAADDTPSGTTSTGDDPASSDSTTAQPGSTSVSDSTDTGGATDSDSGEMDTWTSVDGTVEKGPFILGSQVDVIPLDALGATAGSALPTLVQDDLGTFAIDIPGPLARASAEGFAFDEVSGVLSIAQVRLDAVLVLGGGTTQSRINVLTDLQTERALALIGDGVDPSAAMAQSADELVAALPIGVGYSPAEAFSAMAVFGSGSLDDAYLLAASTTILQAAHEDAGAAEPPWTPAAAQTQALLEEIASDLADDGMLQPTLVGRLRTASHHIDAQAVLTHLQGHASALGVVFNAPPLTAMLDYDEDGVDDAQDNCFGVPNPGQEDDDANGEGDACANCTDPTLSDTDNDSVPDDCDTCPNTGNATQIDTDADGIGNPCDACPLQPPGQPGPCCDPRQASTHCLESDFAINNTNCSDGAAGFSCSGLTDFGYGYGEWCLGGCAGFGSTCALPDTFPEVASALGFACSPGESCCTRYCTVGNDASCALANAVTPPTCLTYYEPGTAPAGFEDLGLCVDTQAGPCAAAGAHARACALGL